MARKPARKDAFDPIPDDLCRRDQPQRIPPAPGSMPRPDEERQADGTPPIDGGVEQHPVHDEDLEDRGPEDFEQEIEEVASVRQWEDD